MQAALHGFDYLSLDTETRGRVQAATERLHMLERRTGEAIIEIGRQLIAVKADIGHGNFGAWLESEFGWTPQTAGNFMRVTEAFGENEKIFQNASPSALYALASGTMPEPIRDEFIARAEAGERITHKDVKQRLAVVDLDSGEIDPEPVPSEPYDGPIIPRHQSHSTPLISPVVNNTARSFSDSLVRAQAPAVVAQSIADAHFKVRGALRVLSDFAPGVIAENGDTADIRDRLDDIIAVANSLAEKASGIRDELRFGERLRAVK